MSGRYFSMKSKRTWQRGHTSNLHVTDEGLALRSIYSYQPEITIMPDENDRPWFIKDFAIDRRILIYILDDMANIWVYDFQGHNCECLIRRGKGLFTNNALIAVADDTLLVIDPAGEEPVIAFSCQEAYPLWSKGEIDGQGILPLAVVADRAGFFYILAVNGPKGASPQGATNKVDILKYDKNGQLLERIPLEGMVWDEADLDDPGRRERFSLCCDADNRLFLLDSRERRLYSQDKGDRLTLLFPVNMLEKPSGLGVDKDHNIYLGDRRRLDAQAEDDRFVYIFDSAGGNLEKITGYRGSIDKMILEEGGRIVAYNGETDNLHLFNLKRNIMFDLASGGNQGIYLSCAFDSQMLENEWHRIELLADIPDETQILLSYFAADEDTFNYKNQVWKIDDFIKREDLSIAEKLHAMEGFWQETVLNPYDLLIKKAKGRYLWLGLQLKGTNHEGPSINRLRVYYRRKPLLQYLPLVYQDDAGGDFLDRFLAIFESFFDGFDEEIAAIPSYFDVRVRDGEFLRWLATWIGVPEDQDWDEEILRRYVENSPEIFRKRGTRQGLIRLIEVFTGEKPFIVEYPQIKYMKDNPEMATLMEKLYMRDPNSFIVLMKKECFKTRRMAMQIERLLEEEKPAFSEAHLVILGENLYLDAHSYLGINSALTEVAPLFLSEGASIPFETVLVEGKDNMN